MRGFKNFLMRGDVIVVAVGLVIALAFSAVITAFTSQYHQPDHRQPPGVRTATAWAFMSAITTLRRT